MPNIIIHPTRTKRSRCQRGLLRAGDDERSTGYRCLSEEHHMEGQQLLIPCSSCGGNRRNHHVLKEYINRWGNEDIQGESVYQICKCAGCNDIRFRIESSNSDDIDYRTGEAEIVENVYPEAIESSRLPIDTSRLPDSIARIYKETVIAFNAGALILAGGGLRATVEALCQDKNVPDGNLQSKIDNLAGQGFLAAPQADLLHEERYLGNAALHEIVAPSKLDVQDGFDIIDTLLTTIYILPDKAERLRLKRTRQPAP
jgi:hypothetical protein